jgi:hypothetical protein
MEEMRNTYIFFKPENKKTLGRHWGVWDDNIKTDVK